MALRWRNTFSCNIKEIDIQHKRLFEISSRLNILEPICANTDFEEEILEILRELRDYTIYHFEYEEHLMQKYQYPHFEIHHAEHQVFVKKMIEYWTATGNFSSPEYIRSILAALLILLLEKIPIRYGNGDYVKDIVFIVLLFVTIPVITMVFMPIGSVTIWAASFLFIIVSMVFNKPIVLVSMTIKP